MEESTVDIRGRFAQKNLRMQYNFYLENMSTIWKDFSTLGLCAEVDTTLFCK